MFNPDLRDVMEEVSSRYALVSAVAKRAREISAEAKEEGETLSNKAVSIALDEIINGDVKVIEVDDENNDEDITD